MEPPLLAPGSAKEGDWVAVCMELLHWMLENIEEWGCVAVHVELLHLVPECTEE